LLGKQREETINYKKGPTKNSKRHREQQQTSVNKQTLMGISAYMHAWKPSNLNFFGIIYIYISQIMKMLILIYKKKFEHFFELQRESNG